MVALESRIDRKLYSTQMKQVIDIDGQIENAAKFKVRLRQSLASANGPRRDELYVLSTALWVELVRRLSECSTYYEMESVFEPDAFGKNAVGDRYHHNKWSKYAVGLSRPVNALVVEVERRLPGCARVLYHPLWEILRQGFGSNRSQRESWLSRISPDVQRIVVKNDIMTFSINSNNDSTTRPKLEMLERRAGIDSLACLSLLLVQANDSQRTGDALRIAEALYRVLLITCMRPPYSMLENELFDCFKRRLFSRIQHAGQCLALEKINFPEATSLLLQQVLVLEDTGRIGLAWKDTIKACHRLLCGKYGFDVKFALNPPFGLSENAGDIDKCTVAETIRSQKRWEWCMSSLRSGRVAQFPPTELL